LSRQQKQKEVEQLMPDILRLVQIRASPTCFGAGGSIGAAVAKGFWLRGGL
jgi:hypothetical protein